MLKLQNLHNSYYVLRHGQSEANIRGIVVSHIKNGRFQYGLTDKGRKQIIKSVKQAKLKGLLNKNAIIISSPFLRCKETAEIAQKILDTNEITYTEKLSERDFGLLEMKNFDYIDIWEKDAEEPEHTYQNVENTISVSKRALELIDNLEKKYENKTILLVSHGDVLQILQTAFEDIDPSKHRSLVHLENGEVRELFLKKPLQNKITE